MTNILQWGNYIIFTTTMATLITGIYLVNSTTIALSVFLYWTYRITNLDGGHGRVSAAVFVATMVALLFYDAFTVTFPNAALGKTVAHMFAFVGLVAQIIFATKTLVRKEEKSGVKAPKIFATFLMFWFFPVGAWLLQPRINAVARYRNYNK